MSGFIKTKLFLAFVSFYNSCRRCSFFRAVVLLTSLAVIPSVTRGRAKMQKAVTPRLTRITDSETDGHAGVITVSCVALRGVSRKLTIHGGVSISHAPCLPCLIDTISCSNHCMLTLYCLIAHSTVIS